MKQLSKKSVCLCSQKHLLKCQWWSLSLKKLYFSKLAKLSVYHSQNLKKMHLKHENYSFEAFYFRHSNNIQVSSLSWNCKSPSAKHFDGNTLKMKANISTWVLKNKKQYSQMVFARVCTLVLRIGHVKLNLSRPGKSFRLLRTWCIKMYSLNWLTILQHKSQFAFTFSKLTKETLEQGVKYVQS